ncbi:MAG TPA: tripartite tricarboxylate transporter TctB family protein [Casimicrobiaceae bacterium]|nr:tripartite tricarboxylate transporter TctB family protein [Casimicrobiaceae bacterium]
MRLIRHPKDFWSGVLFIVFGGAACIIALDYAMGSAGRMGPGYFPRSLGVLLAALGALLVLRSFRLQGEKISFPTFMPLLVVLGSVLIFGFALNHLGLVLSVMLLVVLSSFASHEFSWKEALISSLALATFCVIAFRYGLKLQIPTWPPFLGA